MTNNKNNNWRNIFPESIFFITPDVMRGIGLENQLPGYHIICSYYSPVVKCLRERGANIFCLEEVIGDNAHKINNSGKLLSRDEVDKYIANNTDNSVYIMYFKPSLKIDLLCRQKGYHQIANNRDKNNKFEDKVNFFQITNRYFKNYHIPGEINILGKTEFGDTVKNYGLPFVVQFASSWGGKNIYFIRSKEKFLKLAKRFPYTRVRVSKKINGLTILNNCCIYSNRVLVGPAAIQLSGIAKLHSNIAVTCGRQWPVDNLTQGQIEKIFKISKKIGNIMRLEGFRGFFGLDFIVDQKTGKVYIAENNARLTASSSFYSKLELICGKTPLITYHIAAFLGKDLDIDSKRSVKIFGSQIIFRLEKNTPRLRDNFGVYKLIKSGYKYIKKDYFPEGLKDDEFIFIKNPHISTSASIKETARIETKMPALQSTGNLEPWINNLL